MKQLFPLAAAALALTGASPGALASTQIGEYLTFSGFGTLGAVQTNSDEGKYNKDWQTKGGADKAASLDVDSNLGLQLTGNATRWLSATVQLLASKRDKGHVEPQFEWAYLTVKPVEGLTVRGGRMAAPVFAISDSRNIGYANTWVRAPNEVYGLNVFRRMEGLDATYSATVGPVGVAATVFAGKTDFKALGKYDASGDKLKGLNVQLETAWATFRFGQMTTDVAIPAFRVTGDRYKFTGVGVTVDRDNLVAQGEFVTRRSSLQPTQVDSDGWYLMGGYRFGKVLPYAIRSVGKPKNPAAPFLISAKQETTALGVRWDAFSAAAIKFQVDRVDTGNTKGISFTTPATPPPVRGAPAGVAPVTKPVTVVSLAVDFTF